MKLKCDKLLSNFAFNFNLRHYNWVEAEDESGNAFFHNTTHRS